MCHFQAQLLLAHVPYSRYISGNVALAAGAGLWQGMYLAKRVVLVPNYRTIHTCWKEIACEKKVVKEIALL